MKRFLHNLELRKLFMVMTGLVIVLLIAIAGLAVKQYLLYRHCEDVVARSDRLLFQFTTIKEHINESLLSGQLINIHDVSQEIQGFDTDIKHIVDDFLIPKEFKTSFISQVDLVGLVVQLRAVQNPRGASPQQLTQLSLSLRSISNRIHQFHQVLTTYTQQLLLGLHKIVAGTLALVIFIVTTMLFLLHRYISEPIVQLFRTVQTVVQKNDHKNRLGMHASIEHLQTFVREISLEQQHLHNLLGCIDNVRQMLPESMDHPEDWETLCQALQTNPDYFLVWIGCPEKDASYPDPITGCGCTSSSPLECRQTIDHLVKFCRQEGGLCDSARKAAEQRKSIVKTVSTMNIPEILLRAMPKIPQHIASASFPVISNNALITVITIYSAEADCFSLLETGMLNVLFQHIISTPAAEPEKDHGLFALYKFSVAGALTANLAHEMTNISNGALNYTQALLDLSTDTPGQKEERLLLEKLYLEEKKMADLSGAVHQITLDIDQKAQKITLPLLINCVIHLLERGCKQENIKIQTELATGLPEIRIPVADLQMVLLTVLHRAIQQLLALPVDQQRPSKNLTIKAGREADNDQNIWITVDHFPDEHNELLSPRNDEPWPSFHVCKQILHALEGTMTIETQKPYKSICRITVPTIS